MFGISSTLRCSCCECFDTYFPGATLFDSAPEHVHYEFVFIDGFCASFGIAGAFIFSPD